ncbi:MAG: hypothetical protein IPK60_17630 [Sandaracinaceae bacterium]|nr:hypothetical protein [Sandaracinaceae bacterium]
MHVSKILGIAVVLGGFALVGCGDDATNTPTDAGTGTDSAVPLTLDPPVAWDRSGATPVAATIDLACRGSNTRPVETGAATSFDLRAEDFQNHTPVPDVAINFYPDNLIPASRACTGTCFTAMTNSDGRVTVTDALGSWYAYYIAPRDCSVSGACPTAAATPVPTVQYNEIVPAATSTAVGNSVSQATLGLIPTVLGLSRQNGTAIVAGALYDCNDLAVQNLVIRMFKADGTEIIDTGGRTQPAFKYFNGDSFPDGTQTNSNTDGLYAAANIAVPADGTPLRMESWGMVDGEMHMIGCEEALVFADGVTVMNLRPFRSDGPSNCSE